MEKKNTNSQNRVIVATIPQAGAVKTPEVTNSTPAKPEETAKVTPAKGAVSPSISLQDIAEQERRKFEELRVYLREKEQMLTQLESIERTIANLEELQEDNNNCDDPVNLFQEEDANFLLTISGKKENANSYRRGEYFKLNNPEIISDILEMIIAKLQKRAESLRAEIAAA